MALPSIGSVGRITKAAAAGVASGALRVARNTALAGVGAVLSQSPMTAMLLGILGSGVAKGREVYQQLSDHMEGVEEASTKTEANTGKLVTEAQKENTLTRQGHKLFGKMIESLAGIKNALTNQFMRQRRDSVLTSMRNFKVPTIGPASTVTPQKEEGGMGFFGKLGLMMLAKRLLEIIGTGLLGAAGPAMAGGALFKGLGSLVWTVGKKAIKFAGPLGLAIGLGMSLFDGIVDAFEEYRNSGSLGESLIKGISSFFSSLTFGLVSKEQVEGIVRPVVETIGDALRWVADLAISIGEKLKKAVETVEGWYKALVSKIPSWDDLVASFPEWVQKIFKDRDPALTSNNPNENNAQRTDEVNKSIAKNLQVLQDPNASEEEKAKARQETLDGLKRARDLKRQRGHYLAAAGSGSEPVGMLAPSLVGSLSREEAREKAKREGRPVPPVVGIDEQNETKMQNIKAAMEIYANSGLLSMDNPLHRKMQSFFLEGNKNTVMELPPKERLSLMKDMIVELNAIYQKGGMGAIKQYREDEEKKHNEQIDKLKDLALQQGATEETIRKMLSNSPPFLMTIRDAILGDLNTPSVYTQIIEVLDDIYEAIVETTRLISGDQSWDPKAIVASRRPERFGSAPTMSTGGVLTNSPSPGGSSYTGTAPAGPSTPFQGSQKEFYDTMYKTLLDQAKAKGVENPEAIARLGVAQSALETGYGKKLAGGNNYFGIKDFSGKGDNVQRTREVINGKEVYVNAAFRRYNNMEESAGDYIDFLLKNKRYKDVLAQDTAESAIAAQGKTGYATDPTYASKLMRIHQRGSMDNTLSVKPSPGSNNPQGEALISQAERIKTLSSQTSPDMAVAPETTQPPIVVAPTVVSPQASSGQPKNVSGFSTMPVRNSEWDFRKWNTDSMLRAMA